MSTEGGDSVWSIVQITMSMIMWLFSKLVITPRPRDASMQVEGTSRLTHEGEGGRWVLVAPRMRSGAARLSPNIELRALPTANPLSIINRESSASDPGRLDRSTSAAYTLCVTDRVLIIESREKSVAKWVLPLPVFLPLTLPFCIQLSYTYDQLLDLSLAQTTHYILLEMDLTRMPFLFQMLSWLRQWLMSLAFKGASATRSPRCTATDQRSVTAQRSKLTQVFSPASVLVPLDLPLLVLLHYQWLASLVLVGTSATRSPRCTETDQRSETAQRSKLAGANTPYALPLTFFFC